MKDFDELLDEVLRDDGLAEPRAGLEGRVMARVRGEGISRLRNRWRGWLLVPAAACMGIVAAVWYMGVTHPYKVASRASVPVLSARSPSPEKPETVGDSRGLGGSSRALRHAHLSDGEAVAKMGHPVYRGMKRVRTVPEDEPKLESFPAVSQKGDIAGWLGGGDGGKLAAIAREASPETVTAYQQLRSIQDKPIDIAAIEIKPLR